MWLRLDLEGIDLRTRISGYQRRQADDEAHGGLWCKVDLHLQAQDWLHYRKDHDEVLECDEVERLRDGIRDLLDHKTDRPTVMNCTEPDFEFRFYPAGEAKNGDHVLYVKQGCFEIKDVFMDFALSFYDKDWGLMTTQLVMFFDRSDLEKLLCYLRFITGTVSAGDKEVISMIEQGCLYESDEEYENNNNLAKTFRVKYTAETVIGGLTHGRIYEVKYIEDALYCIHDDNQEDSLWHPDYFEIVEGCPDDVDEYETEPIKEEEMNE